MKIKLDKFPFNKKSHENIDKFDYGQFTDEYIESTTNFLKDAIEEHLQIEKSKIHILAICHKTKCQSNPMVDKTLKVFAYHLTNHKLEFQLAKKLVQGFGLDNSFFHIEAKKKSTLSLIEWTPRGCGSRLSSVLLSRLYKKNIPVIRVSMFLKNYEFPKFKDKNETKV